MGRSSEIPPEGSPEGPPEAMCGPVSLDEHLRRVRSRRKELGLAVSEEATEALRNKGHARTPEKRALLRSIRRRALRAGLKPVKAYY